MKKSLAKSGDHYYMEDGYMVFTEKYHLDQGFCCGNGCRHCPFEYESVPEPRRSELLARIHSSPNGKNKLL